MDADLVLSYEFIKAHPTDAARILERLSVEETAPFLRETPPSLAAGIVKAMDQMIATRCLELMEVEPARTIIAHLPLQIASLILRRMGSRESIIKALPDDTSALLRLLLSYPVGTAGALMDPKVFTLLEEITVEEALKRFRKDWHHSIQYVFILNREQRLIGLINLCKLFISDQDLKVSTLVDTETTRILAGLSQEAIIAHPGWQQMEVLPVVDESGIFLGAIDYRTLRRLESDNQDRLRPKPLNSTGSALAELYWVGLSGLIKGAASVVNRR
jgi:Mg/Co/Ni transporter MgtE